MQKQFNAPRYDTPATTKRSIWDRLLLNSRWYFVFGYLKVILTGRALALKGLYTRKAWVETSFATFNLIERCGGKFHLEGLDNLSYSDGPYVFVSNHMSTLETFIFPCLIGSFMPVTFVVKESLVKHKLFGPVMRARHPIVVKRVNPKEDFQAVITQGKKHLADGRSVIIFPQSTRSVTFDPEKFNSLGIKLAKAAGVSVIPVAIKTDFWGNGKYFKDLATINRSKPIYMSFGKPFVIQGTGKEEHKMVIDFIQSHLSKWE